MAERSPWFAMRALYGAAQAAVQSPCSSLPFPPREHLRYNALMTKDEVSIVHIRHAARRPWEGGN
jgi:hypothetical protein